MAISTIREYTDEDKARVRAAAVRFCDRHNIRYYGDDDAEQSIDYWLHSSHPSELAYRRKLWIGVYCRALRVAYDVRTTTGWGYIGVSVD
jgi:hypothetical protein